MYATVILANGDFPRKNGRSWEILEAAKRVVACDGAARAYHRRFRRWPDAIVGDMDSLKGPVPDSVEAVKVSEQDTNDLAKAISHCRARGWRNLVIVGATGRREDHAIGNVFRALDARVPIVSDFGAFHPVVGKASFRCRKGAGVSIFAPDPETRMTSRGLVWPLAGVRFGNLYCATLNRATSTRFTVTSDRPVSVYVES